MLDTAIYFLARALRRRLPTTLPIWLRRSLPFLDRNFGARDGGAGVVGLYGKYLAQLPAPPADWPRGLCVMEAGVGMTNGSCYALAARGAVRALALEPFVKLDTARDAAQLAGVADKDVASRVERILSTAAMPGGSVDCILSNSVLEHVTEFDAFAVEMARLLAPGGFMLHVVDYRDHFFRYPYHFLLFSRATWRRWLDPGDLPRWRIGDHIAAFERAGLRVNVVLARPRDADFARVKNRIHPEWAARSERDLATAYGVLHVTHRG